MSAPTRFTATYRVHAGAAGIEARAQGIAVEQSVEMPVGAIRSRKVLDEIVGRVEGIEAEGKESHLVRIALAVETTGYEASQFLNMAFGNTSMHTDVELVDLELPDALLESFAGPAFGIAGIRELTGVQGRALTATALKPQGMAIDELARLASQFALAGLDVIKDDHGLANQRYSPFEQRVVAVQQAVDRANAESGGNAIYAPTVSGGPVQMAQQARFAREAGVRMLLAAPMLAGLPAFQEWVAAAGLPVLGHPAFAGAQRIAPPLLLGKLFRMFGADAAIFPNHGGRFAYPPQTCRAIADAARVPLGTLRPALPVPAGGMSVERVPGMLAFYGEDVMLLIGGALLEAGDKLTQVAREFVAAVARRG